MLSPLIQAGRLSFGPNAGGEREQLSIGCRITLAKAREIYDQLKDDIALPVVIGWR